MWKMTKYIMLNECLGTMILIIYYFWVMQNPYCTYCNLATDETRLPDETVDL